MATTATKTLKKISDEGVKRLLRQDRKTSFLVVRRSWV